MTGNNGDLLHSALARSSRRAGLVSALGLILLVGAIGYSYIELGRVRAQIETKKLELSRLEADLAKVTADLGKVTAELKLKQQQTEKLTPVALSGLGYKDPYAAVSPKAIDESIDANKVAVRLADPAQRKRRGNITLQYYAKKLDDEVNMQVVLSALTDAGFALQQKRAQIPGTPTNAIFFGPDVEDDDIKFVALTLIGAGIQLRTIQKLQPAVSRPRLIQIGADQAYRDASPLSASYVINASSFTR